MPSGLSNVGALTAGWHYSVAMTTTASINPAAVTLVNPQWNNNIFTVSLSSQNGTTYTLQYKNSLPDTSWTSLSPMAGNGGLLTLIDPGATAPQRVYRVQSQ